MKNRVKISIDGKSFTLVGEESEEHIRSVAAYIDEKMTEVREKAVAVTLDSSLAYVLTSVNVADDYFKEKAYTAELEGRLIGMTARVQNWRISWRKRKRRERMRKTSWMNIFWRWRTTAACRCTRHTIPQGKIKKERNNHKN